MSLINISGLTFGYEGSSDNVFENVSFQVDTDWKLGLIGRNGRGKTTFLRLLCGKLPYSGTVTASVSFDYFPFEIPDRDLSTAGVLQRLNPDPLPWEIEKELSLLDAGPELLGRPFSTLSSGEQTKVLLVSLFLKKNNFLLIDEPTNHLDAQARKTVSRYLGSKKGFILVSHDRQFLDGCVDHILSINKMNIEIQRGNFSSWKMNRDRQDGFELMRSEKLKKDIARLEEAAARASGWSEKLEKTKKGALPKGSSGLRPDRGYIGHKAAKMMKRSKSIEARRRKAAESKSSLLRNAESAESLTMRTLPYPKKRLVTAENLSVSYDGKDVVKDLSFTIDAGDRLALLGRNGSGKSSILKLLAGFEIPYAGTLNLGAGLSVSYIPQDTSFLSGNLGELARRWRIDESLFKTILRKLDFERKQFEKDASDLSEGQKKKVLIVKSLCKPSNLYIWDEPLNFIDVFSRIQIEELLTGCSPTIVFSEHDARFVQNVATKTLCLQR